MKRASIVLLILSFFLAACKPNQSSAVAVTPVKTSNEALVRALDALNRRDSNALLSLVSGGSKAQDFFASTVDSLVALDAFKQKFVDAYGEDAWNAFQAPLKDDQKRPNMNLTLPDLGQIQKDSSGWEANETNHGEFDLLGFPLRFKQVDGGWVIDGANVFQNEQILVGYTETQRKLTSFTQRYMKAIGHPGISAEDIDYQMGKDFLIAVMGGEFKADGKSIYPDRFKLDEL